MIKKSTKWLIPLFLYFLIFIVCNLVDYNGGSYEGSLRGYQYNRILLFIGVFASIFLLLVGVVSRSTSWRQGILLSLTSVLVTMILLEIFSFILIGTGLVSVVDAPHHHLFNSGQDIDFSGKPFWLDIDPNFGKWRLPNDTLARKTCDGRTIYFRSNSYGARDKERALTGSNRKRVAFLGDSFVEGWMVNSEDRVSERLEKQTGLEHMNFGINGTSPINYYLTYKHLVKKFEHDVLIVGILPANDFEDFTERKRPSLLENPIYKPYWKLDTRPYQLKYSLDSVNLSMNSIYMAEHRNEIKKTFTAVFKGFNIWEKIVSFIDDNSYTFNLVENMMMRVGKSRTSAQTYSRYNTYTDEEWKIFSHSLESLLKEASGKTVFFVVYPILSDLKMFSVSRKARVPKEIEKISKPHRTIIIDLLPYFIEQPDMESLYVSCDGHLSPKGERLVSDILRHHPAYRRALNLDNDR